MDLQTAQRLSGRRWQIAKLAALLCLAIACGLLISSLAASSHAGVGRGETLPSLYRAAS
jgi:putative copper export protein